MPWTSEHIPWLKEKANTLTTVDGKPVDVFEFIPDFTEKKIINAWAKHFRNHYTLDDEIDFFRDGTGYTKKEYLINTKFPTDVRGFGPGIRAGDFAEILVADYLEFTLKHWVPRTRYGSKTIRDESTKGSDLIGFKLFDDSESEKDILTVLEVKAQFSGPVVKPRLQDAIDDSVKDNLRIGESLNAIKQRLFDKGGIAEAKQISRYQNPTDKPYKHQYGAAALFCNSIFDNKIITSANTSSHSNSKDLLLIVISADNFMQIVHQLYNIAADEA